MLQHRGDAPMANTDLHEAWISIRRVAKHIDESVDAVLQDACDLSADYYIALRWLSQRHADTIGVAPAGLEKELNLTSSGLSRLLSRMESNGYLTRTPSSTDRRAIEVTLTEVGSEVLRRAQPFAAEAVQRVLDKPGFPSSFETLTAMVQMPPSGLPAAPAESDESIDDAAATEDISISGVLTWHTVDAVSAADAHVVRQAVEPQVLAEAARYATDASAAELMNSVFDMLRNIDNPEAFFEADTHFHMKLAELCQNRILRDTYVHMLHRLQSTVKAVDGDSETTGPYLAQRAKIHADLVDAIRRHDLDALDKAAREHRLVRISGIGVPGAEDLEIGTDLTGDVDGDSAHDTEQSTPEPA